MIGRATLAALLLAAGSASPAAAQARCAPPDEPGWHSCLTASHRAIDAQTIHLTKVRPRLVLRYEEGCPENAERRTVVVRTAAGERLGRARVEARCRRGVARWTAGLRLDLEVPKGTVVRSYWSGIADSRSAPRVRLGR